MLEGLISTYGYAVIAIGTFLEGETVLVLGGLAAQRGYLELHWVIAAAFIGSLLGDQVYFHLGRWRGRRILERRTEWRAKTERVFALLERHQVLLILGFRFLYGLRTVTPLLLGASSVDARRFILLNAIGALLWAAAIGTLGYLFGHALEIILGNIRRYEMVLFAIVVGCGTLFWIVRALRNRARARRGPGSPRQP